MIVAITADTGLVVEQKHDLKALAVQARGVSTDDVDHVLTSTGLGRLDGEHAWLSIAELRDHARIDDPEWDEEFDAMIDYARSQAWLDESGTAVRAHVNHSATH